MLITLEGVYENGKITFNEVPPFTNRTKVLVTFIEEAASTHLRENPLGTMKGTTKLSDDINDPLDDLKDYL